MFVMAALKLFYSTQEDSSTLFNDHKKTHLWHFTNVTSTPRSTTTIGVIGVTRVALLHPNTTCCKGTSSYMATKINPTYRRPSLSIQLKKAMSSSIWFDLPWFLEASWMCFPAKRLAQETSRFNSWFCSRKNPNWNNPPLPIEIRVRLHPFTLARKKNATGFCLLLQPQRFRLANCSSIV